MSNQPSTVSSSQSGGFINMLCNIPIIGIVVENLMKIGLAECLIRKSANIFLYFVLSILLYKAIKGRSNIKDYSLAFILTTLYACTDEFHQLFIAGRSGEFRDILVDSIGALIGLVLVFLISKIISKIKFNRF
jgi:VanZ family protein